MEQSVRVFIFIRRREIMKHFLAPPLLASTLILVLASYCLAGKPTVFVSILPQKFFVQQLCGDRVDVQVMVKPGASPATYEPKPSQMAALSKTLVYFAIGVPFEAVWLDRIRGVNPDMIVVRTDRGIKKAAMVSHHHHGREEHHNEVKEGIPDPHIWLSPSLVKQLVPVMLDSLKKIVPEHAEEFEKNGTAFVAEVDELDMELRKMFREHQGMEFMVYHPSWGYFARNYGLVQEPIELEGKDPKPSQLKDLIRHARENDIRVIFVQPQFSGKSAKVIAREIGGVVVPADPLALDWFSNLRQVAEKIRNASQ